ncbi:MAG: SUF system Fe-S cluster assembly protein [Candidatus Kapabacteria bacterium]|nr:SUF system Fe-S cluster assembly protein [Candidatus Kapabacteria bacterium]
MNHPELKEAIIEKLKTVFDPEIPVNIYDLGLIYDITIREDATVHVLMTLTAPGCPVAGTLPGEIAAKVREVDGVVDASVELTFDPPWDKTMMPEFVKLELGLF